MKQLSTDLKSTLMDVVDYESKHTIKQFIIDYYFESDDEEFFNTANEKENKLEYIKEYFKEHLLPAEVQEDDKEDFMYLIKTRDSKQCQILFDLMTGEGNKDKEYDPEILHDMYNNFMRSEKETPLSSIRRATTSLVHSSYLIESGKREGKYGAVIKTYKLSNKRWEGIAGARVSVFTLKGNIESELAYMNSSNVVALLTKIHETFMNCNNKLISKGRWDDLYNLLSKIQNDLEQAEKAQRRAERKAGRNV